MNTTTVPKGSRCPDMGQQFLHAIESAHVPRAEVTTHAPHTEISGAVESIEEGVVHATGLRGVGIGQTVTFASGIPGIVNRIRMEGSVHHADILVLGSSTEIHSGETIRSRCEPMTIGVGYEYLGRVIDPTGYTLDGGKPVTPQERRRLVYPALGMIDRGNVDTPLMTGLLCIDAMTPIGRGQRQLFIGDSQTGTTTNAVDTIINQKGQGVYCILCMIGQKKSRIAYIRRVLSEHGAMDYTVIISADADSPVAQQYIAPTAACSMGEFFMYRGEDALVVFDNLTEHSAAARAVAAMTGGALGRDRHASNIFTLHAQPLERSARRADWFVLVGPGFSGSAATAEDSVDGIVHKGPMAYDKASKALVSHPGCRVVKVAGSGGSLTAIPIVTTLLGDVSAYIPTNVISITDGQCFTTTDRALANLMPAVDPGISVSRVGGDAQYPAINRLAKPVRLSLAQYEARKATAQLGAEEMDETTKEIIRRGMTWEAMLTQPQHEPYTFAQEVALLMAGNGRVNDVPVARIDAWKTSFLRTLRYGHAALCADIEAHRTEPLSPANEALLEEIILKSKALFVG